MQTIRSTQKLASTNTHGLCDVKRTIVKNTENRNRNTGVLESITLVILSRKFQEQTIEIDGNEIIERKYITGKNQVEKDHEHAWTFTIAEIDGFKEFLSAQLAGKSYEEQQLIIFIAQTQTAGDNGNGWQNMNDWLPDTGDFKVVNRFTIVE